MLGRLQNDDSDKLVISGLACDCPCGHSSPRQDIHVGSGLLKRLPEMRGKRGPGSRYALVADNVT